MDRGKVPTSAIPLQSVGWIREGRRPCSVGRGSIFPLVPVQSQNLVQSQHQMRRLSRWMQWVDRAGHFQLRHINAQSTFIHWRYQVLMAENLERARRLE